MPRRRSQQTERQRLQRWSKQITNYISEKPISCSIILIVSFLLFFGLIVGIAVSQPQTPTPPVETMTFGKFVEKAFEFQLPAVWWVLILLFLWLTKWS